MRPKEHIVIVGGGFAVLCLAKKLNKKKFDITLIDSNNYHSFPPLFYQVASSGLEPAGICFPFRSELRRFKNDGCRYRIGKVTTVDLSKKTLSTQYETIGFDRLVIAAGTTNNFFGKNDLEKKVYTLKSTSEAMRLRNDILERLEMASIEPDHAKQRSMLNFVVIGAGPTGVEIAGALGEMKRYIIPRDYPSLYPDMLSISVIEGSDRVLATMSDSASDKAKEYLEDLAVDLHLSTTMTDYDTVNGTVCCSDGSAISASMVIWTAGVTAVPFEFIGHDVETGRGHRIAVDRYNRLPGIDGVYAVGDICIMTEDPKFPAGHPQLAQVAIQQAVNLAGNLNGDELNRPFSYHDKGSMATVGRNRAVVDLPAFKFAGFPAWLTWMFIHLISIIGFRNRLTVLINWIWAYFTFGSQLRLLFKASNLPNDNPKQ